MATNNLIDHYDRRTLGAVAEELLEPKTFLQKTFINNTDAFAALNVDFDIYKGKRRTAAYVRRAAQGQLIDAIGFQTRTVTPPYLKPRTPITPSDIQKRDIGGSIYDNTNTLAPAIQKFVARQIADQAGMIDRNKELQVMQALFEGKVTARGETGAILSEVDYGRESTLTYTVSPLWSTTSDKLEDCRAARRLVSKFSGFSPRLVLMGATAARYFLADTTIQNALSKDWSTRGNLAYDMRDDGGVWLGHADGFDFWTYEEYIIDPADGVQKLLIPEGKVLVAAPEAMFSMLYGGIETCDNDGNLSIVAEPYYVDMYGERDPAAAIVQTHCSPLAVPHHVDAYAVLTVI